MRLSACYEMTARPHVGLVANQSPARVTQTWSSLSLQVFCIQYRHMKSIWTVILESNDLQGVFGVVALPQSEFIN